MKTTQFILTLVLTLSWAPAVPAGERAPERPNIVVILADDLGYGDPGCYNKDSRIPTPNLDRLATQGMRFTDAHSPSAVCTPSRYGLLTGRYCWRTKFKNDVLFGYDPLLIEPGRMTIASMLRLFKYYTACIGKWHLGLGNTEKTNYAKPLTPGPNSVGFDYFFGIPAALDMPPYVYIENERLVQPPTMIIRGSIPRKFGGAGFWRPGPIAVDFRHREVQGKLTDKAVEVIGKQTADRPFFLYFALSAVHFPIVPAKQFEGKTKVGDYGDLVFELDDTVGRIMNALEKAKLDRKTLVIFTSDNGAYWPEDDIKEYKHRANANLHGQKADIWEGGHRIPFIARWPGKIPAGTTSGETICHTDLMATIAAIVGKTLPPDAGEDSFDLLPVLQGKKPTRPVREATIHHSFDGTLAIRQGPWRLANALGSRGFTKPIAVEPRPGGPRGELYNLEVDPEEKNNRWLQEPDTVRRLTALLEKLKNDGRSRAP
jgi:arylsulfatase A-like enzyme